MKAYLDIEEIKLLEAAATNLRDRLLIRLLFHLGCRVLEAISITVGDIDLQQGTINIQHLKIRLNFSCPACNARLGKHHKFCPGCGVKVEEIVTREKEHRRVRKLPADTDTLKMIKEYIQRGGAVNKSGKRFLFGINRHRAWQIVKECAEKAGVPKVVNPETGKVHNVSPHRLRDSFAIHAVKRDDSGDGLRLLQEHLGHQSIVTTMRYRKVAGEEHREWYQRLWEKNTANGDTT